MQEQIDNFREMIENFYQQKMKKNDIVFDFLHVSINYTYMSYHHPVRELLKESGIQLKYEDRRQHCSETLFVPVIVGKQYYDETFGDDVYYTKRTFSIKEEIDIGDTKHFHYEEIYQKLKELIPKECTIIYEEEMEKIAHFYGYDKFGWEIYDKAKNLPAVFYSGPEWIYHFYGIKEKEEKLNNKR